MKQKIVIQMKLDSDKCRSKALKIAAQELGVSSVALEGDSNDKLVVTGDVDAVCLARVLRKKFQCVTLVSVQEVKKKDDDKSEEIKDLGCYYYAPYCPPPPCSAPPCGPYYCTNPYPNDSNCSIM